MSAGWEPTIRNRERDEAIQARSLDSRTDTPRPSAASAGRLVRPPDGKARLIGTVPITIGREPSSDFPLEGEDVSRSHTYLLRTPQGFLLVDSSLHGTYVNGVRVQAQRMPARPEKAGLVLAVAKRPSWKARVGTWIRRYGLSELFGIGVAFGGSWLLGTSTGSAIAAAYGASVGEPLGFYGSLVIREMIHEAYVAGGRRAPYGAAEMMRTWQGLLLEFGPGELLDTGLMRPIAMGIGTSLFGWGLGIVAGKLVADVAFYLPVIWTYERRRKSA